MVGVNCYENVIADNVVSVMDPMFSVAYECWVFQQFFF